MFQSRFDSMMGFFVDALALRFEDLDFEWVGVFVGIGVSPWAMSAKTRNQYDREARSNFVNREQKY